MWPIPRLARVNDLATRVPPVPRRHAGVPVRDVAGRGVATRSPPAGGALIAIGAVLGAFIGLVVGQPTPGLLVGLGLGIAAALAVWWRGRA